MSRDVDESDRKALEVLDVRLRTLLPDEYQDSYESVQPVSMGSAGLKYSLDGKVAWDRIWGSFCDLAMAGGPPHKGTLLEPGRGAEIESLPARYDEVVAEICRGVTMVTELQAQAAPTPGWIRVECLTRPMAGWLLRAIVMENVAARAAGLFLDLPAAPRFRLEKEIKNVVTVIAKTCHYWLGHIPRAQQRAIGDLFASLEEKAPLIVPDDARAAGWRGVECSSVQAAVWKVRALVACNVLARREGTVLFVPINPSSDPDGAIVSNAVARVDRLAALAVQSAAPPS